MSHGVKNLMEVAIVLVGVVVASFLLMHWLPGDPAELYAGEDATERDIERLRRRMGLDQPVWVQMTKHAYRLVQGDLGESLRSGRPVGDEIRARLPTTLRLTGLAILVSLLVGFPAGLATASSPHGALSRMVDWASLTVLAVPVYWLGLLLILIFAVFLRWLPPSGSDSLRHLVLPAFALGLHAGAALARVLRASVDDVLGQAYIRTARGKGAPSLRILWLHVLPNALIPVTTYFAMEIGRLLGGAVLTETVFAVNGIGRFLVTSIAFRDYPAVVGVVLFIAVCVTLTNAAADMLCRLLDPRTRHER